VSSSQERHQSPGAAARAARKDTRRGELELKRLERSIEKLAEYESALTDEMQASATDHARLAELQADLEKLLAERERLETAWLELSESLER
jgi:ATP-binding cassette subfamily F protein uup